MMQPSPSLYPFMLVTSTQMHRQGEIASKSDFYSHKATMHVVKLSMPMPLYMGTSLLHMLDAASMALALYHLSPLSNKVVIVRFHFLSTNLSGEARLTYLHLPLLALATFSVV